MLGLVAAGGSVAFGACGREPSGSRARADLYDCEGCDAAGERPAASLSSIVELAPASEPGERLVLSGRVLGATSRQPVEGVVIYAHQTNAEGLYAGGRRSDVWSSLHGRLKAWVRSDAQGRYRFNTIKPAPYPDATLPAHIHLYILEPGRRPYYVDDVVFAGEFGVTDRYRRRQDLRGGSGIVQLTRGADGLLSARRDIVLERHPA